MIIASHAVVGAVSAQMITESALGAFTVGFLSHFILDTFPHWDYSLETPIKGFTLKPIIKDLCRLSLDFLVGVFLIFIFFQWGKPFNLILWFGMIGSILPDILHNLSGFWKIKTLKFFSKLHNWFHCQKDLKSPWIGLTIQAFVIIVFILFG